MNVRIRQMRSEKIAGDALQRAPSGGEIINPSIVNPNITGGTLTNPNGDAVLTVDCKVSAKWGYTT